MLNDQFHKSVKIPVKIKNGTVVQFDDQPLPSLRDGAVGDVHGEFDALCSLMRKLGYDDDWQHPDGRRLIFVVVATTDTGHCNTQRNLVVVTFADDCPVNSASLD